MNVDDMVAKAAVRINAMDDIDRRSSFTSPGSPKQLVQTAELALRASLSTEDWGIAAEAIVYLRSALDKWSESE